MYVFMVPIVEQMHQRLIRFGPRTVRDRHGIPRRGGNIVVVVGRCASQQIGTIIASAAVFPSGGVRILAHALHPQVRVSYGNDGQYIVLVDPRGHLGRVRVLVMRRRVFPPRHLPPHALCVCVCYIFRPVDVVESQRSKTREKKPSNK